MGAPRVAAVRRPARRPLGLPAAARSARRPLRLQQSRSGPAGSLCGPCPVTRDRRLAGRTGASEEQALSEAMFDDGQRPISKRGTASQAYAHSDSGFGLVSGRQRMAGEKRRSLHAGSARNSKYTRRSTECPCASAKCAMIIVLVRRRRVPEAQHVQEPVPLRGAEAYPSRMVRRSIRCATSAISYRTWAFPVSWNDKDRHLFKASSWVLNGP